MSEHTLIPRIDFAALIAGDPLQKSEILRGATDVGFMTLTNTPIGPDRVREVIDGCRAFFSLSDEEKKTVDMARTGSNRGWGAPQSERVDRAANPDYKEIFDMGFEVPGSALSVHAPNLWPERPLGFRALLESYYDDARALSLRLLGAVAEAIGAPADIFDAAFSQPMALLRGNYYPSRPTWAGEKDFGIAAHTDYGCLTLLATDGVLGLDVLGRGGTWIPLNAQPGEFVINFGEMLEIWSGGRIKATLHRVIGSEHSRISVPLFFNPNPETNVAPIGSGTEIKAIDHLQRRFDETYLHLASSTKT